MNSELAEAIVGGAVMDTNEIMTEIGVVVMTIDCTLLVANNRDRWQANRAGTNSGVAEGRDGGQSAVAR